MLCEPAKLYLLFTVIFIVMAVFNGITALTVIVKFVFALIWTLVLNWLCSKGFTGLAWIIVLMPFIFLFLTVFIVREGFRGERVYGTVQEEWNKIQAEQAQQVTPPKKVAAASKTRKNIKKESFLTDEERAALIFSDGY